jgi:uncharacterized protein YkwD
VGGCWSEFDPNDSGTFDPDTQCDAGDAWPEPWAELEREVLELVNDARAQGGSCGGDSFGATGALTMQATLQCVARAHGEDMLDREFFDHINPDGDGPSDRVSAAGYSWRVVGENIAAGQTSPREVVDGWLASPGHCRNIMLSDFEEIGVGYVYDEGDPLRHYWTQVFGAR